MSAPLVSVLINNYNYGHFIGRAIDSALAQDYQPIEIVVVDDGSKDDSREVISSYGDRIVPLFKPNGGQASAFNVGVAKSRGDILCFLDADDFFAPGKVAAVVKAFGESEANIEPRMVYHWLKQVDEAGEPLDMDNKFSREIRTRANLCGHAARYHDIFFIAGPTTCVSINRKMADLIFPIPESGARISADEFIVRGSSVLGYVYTLPEELSFYRIHGNNLWFGSSPRLQNDFRDLLQNYLNGKLAANGAKPLIQWRKSIYAADELLAERKWLQLGGLMFKETLAHPDNHTLSYVWEYSQLAVKRMIKDVLAMK